MSQVQSWQIPCPRCRWANSGSQVRCIKCGYPLPSQAGHLVAGERLEQPVMEMVYRPAGVMPRMVAMILDLIILGAIDFVVFIIWQATLPLNSTIHLGLDLLWLYLAITIVWAVYFVGSWTILGASPAGRIFNLQIVDIKGQPITFARAVIRYIFFGNIFSPLNIILWVLSVVMMLITPTKRAIHDAIGGTYVIQKIDETEQASAASGLPPAVAPAAPPATTVPAPAVAAAMTQPPPPPPAPAPAAAEPQFQAPPPPPPAPVYQPPQAPATGAPPATPGRPTAPSSAPRDPYDVPFVPAPPKPPADGPQEP